MSRLDVSHFLALAALLLPPLGALAPAGTTPLLIVAALGVLVLERKALLRSELAPLAVLLGTLAFWGMLSALWSITPWRSFTEALRLLAFSIAGLALLAATFRLDDAGRRRVAAATLAGAALGALGLGIEYLGAFPLRRFARGSADPIGLAALDRGVQILVLVGVPATAALGRRALALVVPLVVALLLWRLKSSTAVVAFAAALVAFALGMRWPRAIAALGAATFLALTVILPFAPPSRESIGAFWQALPQLRSSAHHRLVIWNWTADRIEERPLLGWGFDAARSLPGGKQQVEDYMPLKSYGLDILGDVMPLHPHDAILQWWVELGVLGAALGALLVAYAWACAARAGPFALALVGAAMPPLLLSFGIWQWWWLATLFLVAAIFRSLPSPASPR